MHSRRSKLALVFLSIVFLAVSAFADGFLIKPYLQNITPDGATIMWETAEQGTGTVEYGADFARKAAESQPAKIHRVRLTGLAADSTCPYRVTEGAQTHEASFKTAPAADRPITFIAMGDSRRWATSWQDTRMADHMMQWNPEFIFNNGDLVLDGHKYNLWPEHFNRFGSFMDKVMMLSIRGNHEGSRTNDTDNDWFAKYHELPGKGEPFSTFDWGNTHFISVAMDYISNCAQELDEDLSRTTKIHTVVLFHPPVYCTGYFGPEDSRKEDGRAFQKVLQVLDKHGVELHLAGHTHIYERSYPLRTGKRDMAGTSFVVQGGDINANYPGWFTAAADDRDTMSKPTYTAIKCGDDSIDLRTFAWSNKSNEIVEVDHFIIWRDEAVPKAALAAIDGKTGADLAAAIETVGAMMYEPAVKTVAARLNDPDPAVRRAAAKALRSIGVPAAAEALLPFAKDSDAEVARQAARGLEIAMPEQVARTVAQLACDSSVDELARASLVGALQLHARQKDTMKTIMRLLEDENTPGKVRMRAAYALKSVTREKDVKLLTRLVQKETDKFALQCMGARLNELTRTRVGLKDDQPFAKSAPGKRGDFIRQWLGK